MADSGVCSACGSTILWVITLAGKRMPLDREPAADGNVVPVLVDGKPHARVLTGDELPAQQTAWVPHHRTCPHAADFRRRKAATMPRCTLCRLPMDTDLARLEHWTTHPACDRIAARRPA